MENKILGNRLIAFLDVLGFTALLNRQTLREVHAQYSSFIDLAKTKVFFGGEGDKTGRTNFDYAEFISDSIVLVSHEISDVYNVNNFIGAISFLLEIGFASMLPLRGAVGRGDFLIDEARHIFLSREFSEVVHFEDQQEWTGCSILSSAEDVVLESIFGKVDKKLLREKPLGNNLVLSYRVPLKKNSFTELFIVNFLIFLSKHQIVSGIEYLIDSKKKNTADYFQYLNSLPFQYQSLQPEFLPAVTTLVQTTRSGMRVAFLDINGNPCKPGIENIQWVASGRWRE